MIYPSVLIHHGGCFDGWGAAMVARDALLAAGEPEPIVVPAHYGMDPTGLPVKDATVYVLDFSFPPEQMRWLQDEAHRLVWIDHHKTAVEAVDAAGLEIEGMRSMDRSGIRLTWRHFDGEDFGVPWEVQYIEDRDLWRKELPDHDAVLMWIRSHEMTIEGWKQIRSTEPRTAVVEGKAMATYHDRLVRNAARSAVMAKIGGIPMPLVTVSYDLGSDVCDLLIRELDVPAAAYQLINKAGRHQYGLRSRSDFDVSEIAKHFGGGGHAQAAGFTTRNPVHQIIGELAWP